MVMVMVEEEEVVVVVVVVEEVVVVVVVVVVVEVVEEVVEMRENTADVRRRHAVVVRGTPGVVAREPLPYLRAGRTGLADLSSGPTAPRQPHLPRRAFVGGPR